MNEIGRRAVVDHPGRFGLFAALPLPDVDAAIAEIAHCCDHLDVDGFALLTNVGGTYLGDPSFEPVFRELNRRARAGVHPPDVAGVLGAHVARTAPADARVLLRHDPRRGRPGAQRHRRASHRHRVHHPARRRDAADDRRPGQRLLAAARGRRRRSTCCATSPGCTTTWPASRCPASSTRLLTLTTLEHLHYGSDYPFTPEFAAAMAAERLDAAGEAPGLVDRSAAGQHGTTLPRTRRDRALIELDDRSVRAATGAAGCASRAAPRGGASARVERGSRCSQWCASSAACSSSRSACSSSSARATAACSCVAPLAELRAVGHLLRQRMLEGVLGVGRRSR